MAGDDADEDDKTQDPSERRIDKALEEGNVPRSQDLSGFLVLAAGFGTLITAMPALTFGEAGALAGWLAEAHRGIDSLSFPARLGGHALALLAAPLLAMVLAALLGGMILHRPRIVTAPLMPKYSRIDPLAAARRIFGAQNLVQFAKTLAKLALVLGVVTALLWPRAGEVEIYARLADIRSALPLMGGLVTRLAGIVLALYALIAAADAGYQVFSWKKQLRMTQHEVKEEHKETEGNPEIKARVRQIRARRARQRMMAAVPQATVIITNPTHYAVALRYDAGMPAPVCVAKGVDELALRIRAIGTEHRVPVIENPPLARALHAGVEVDQSIPPEHYKAVAEVIGFVLRHSRRGRKTP